MKRIQFEGQVHLFPDDAGDDEIARVLEPAKKSWLETADDAARSFASGATFGWIDKLAAKGDEALGRGTYAENLARERARDAQIPGAIKYPAEIAGAVGSAIATAPLTAGAAALSGLARLPAAVRAIGGGAAGGALFGAGEAPQGEELSGAGVGAGLGAVAGAVVPPLARGIGAAVSHVLSPQSRAAAELARAIGRDQTTPAELLARGQAAAEVRPGVAALADVGGENLRGLVERAAQSPGAGRSQVVPELSDRQARQMVRITGDLRELTGTQRSAAEAVEEVMDRRAQDSRPLYDQAMNFNARSAPEVVQAWTNATATGFGRAVIHGPNYRRTLQTEYGIADPADAPLMVQIDAWKKSLDDLIGSAQRSGEGNKVRVLSGLRDRTLAVVDRANPAYAAARDAWAGHSKYLDALDEGRNILNRRMGADEVEASLARMSEAEQEAYRVGAVAAIVAKMGSDPARLPDMTKYFRSPTMRGKIAAIMPTPQAQEQWARRLEFEIGASELSARALGNSATARRLAERDDADSIVGDLIADALLGHAPIGILRRAMMALPQRARDTLRSRTDKVLADVLTNPAAMPRLEQTMQRVQARSAPPSPLRNQALIRATNAADQGP